MSNSTITQRSKTINPNSIDGFVAELRSIADEMETMKANTLPQDRAYKAAEILDRHGLS